MSSQIQIMVYDPLWPEVFRRENDRVRTLLGCRALQIEHIGSTSVPGLAAKPIIDILLVVADSSDQPSYVPILERAGYSLRIREPNWHEHRMFKGPAADINLHVFSSGCPEINRILNFRDWLRSNAEDELLYIPRPVNPLIASANWTSTFSRFYFSDFGGGLNGSTQHSSRTRLALKTKAKSLAREGSAGTLPWLGFDRVQPNRSLLPGKHRRIKALDGVASTV